MKHVLFICGRNRGNGESMETKAPLDDQGSQIVSTPGTRGGKPRIDGHRITVQDVVVWHERMGMSPDEIVSAHPTITLAQVHAALAYYFEHKDQIDADIEEGMRSVEELKAKTPPSKLQKLLEARKADGSDDSLPPG